MFQKIRSELRYPAEFFWLIALIFFLPLFEAPKNLCWLGYVVTWLYNRFRAHDWGGPWDNWDSLIAIWITSGYVVAMFAGVHYDEWSSANDILRYGSVLWFVKRSHFSERSLLTILGAIVLGTLVTLLWGFWRFAVVKSEISLTLNSVGQVNHSAIYLAIVFGVALSFSLGYWRQLGIFEKAGVSLSTFILAFSVFLTDSRAAAVAAVLAALALSLVSAVRKARRVGLSLVLVIFGATVLLVANPAIIEKTANQVVGGAAFAFRGDDWKNALVEWRQFPFFGVGMGNFGRPTLSELQKWNAAQDWAIRPSPAGLYGHGHSLYLNTLAERGLVGSAILLAVLISWGLALVRAAPTQDSPIGWTLYGGALSAWVIAVLAGLLNTTLHHEHALLSVLLLGLWLDFRKQSVLPERSAVRL